MNDGARETTFDWSTRWKNSWQLAGLIFLMLVLHSAAFFIFQAAPPAIYPPPRTAPAVQLLTPFTSDGRVSPENQSLLRWIEAEDPALVARVPNVELPAPQEVPYRSSFEPKRPTALDVPPHSPSTLFPPARDPLSVVMSASESKAPAADQISPAPTRVVFSSTLTTRLTNPTPFHPATKTSRPLEPLEFMVGVSDTGEVRYLFLQEHPASTLPALEQEASTYLSKLTFAPAPGKPITWGSATVIWGDDIAQED